MSKIKEPINKNNFTGIQFVLVTDSGTQVDENTRYNFKHFTEISQLMQYISNMSNGSVKVHKIFTLDKDGNTVQKTVGFQDGQFNLIEGEVN